MRTDLVGLAATLHSVPEGLVEVFELPLWQAVWYDTAYALYRAVARIEGVRHELIFDPFGTTYPHRDAP